MLQLEVLGNPTPWCAPRKGKHGLYAPHSAKKEEARWQLRAQWNQELWTGPIYLSVIFYFTPPKSTSNIKRRQMLSGVIHHIKRPDTSNCVKFIEDACTSVIWEDDSQVVNCNSQKMYGTIAKTVISVKKLGIFDQ